MLSAAKAKGAVSDANTRALIVNNLVFVMIRLTQILLLMFIGVHDACHRAKNRALKKYIFRNQIDTSFVCRA